MEYNYLSIQSPFNIKKHKTTRDKDNTIGHNTSTRKWLNIPTQHNSTNTKQRKHTNFTKHYTAPEKYIKIQCNTREERKKTARCDKVRTLLFKNAFQNALDIKCFLKISTQFLFPLNKSLSKRNISFTGIRDQKAMNLLQ